MKYLTFARFICLIIMASSISATKAYSEQNPMNAPWETTEIRPDGAAETYSQIIYDSVFHFYNNTLHSGISSGCPSTPSCSRYMYQAVTQYPLFFGLVLGMERLLHESGEIARGNIVQTPAGSKVADPLKNNTFWWKKSCKNF